jgi:hypothetical protein
MKRQVNQTLIAFFSLVFLVTIASSYPQPSQATPADFEKLKAATGVTLYQHHLDYVQVVDLRKGAALKFLHGEITHPGQHEGAYRGNDPKFSFEAIAQAWSNFSSANQNAFAILNGQFFRPNKQPDTNLAFPVKAEGNVVSDGYAGKGEFPSQQLLLEVWENQADITAFTCSDALYSSSAPNIIVGLAPDANKGIKKEVGRTFIGIQDQNADGKYETILIFNSPASSQPHAAEVLKAFGAEKVMMLDGGSSSQLMVQGTSYVKSSRTIPQTIGVVSGK